MSERLAVSATFSVLMMAAYVLFGADSAVAPIGSDALVSPLAASVSEVAAEAVPAPADLLRIAR